MYKKCVGSKIYNIICDKEYPDTEEFFRRRKDNGKLENICIKCQQKRNTAWVRDNPDKRADIRRKMRYGISPEEYNNRLFTQNNLCKICGNPETASNGKRNYDLAVDHDHKTGKIRGLLCLSCNKDLGIIEKYLGNKDLQRKINEYLNEI